MAESAYLSNYIPSEQKLVTKYTEFLRGTGSEPAYTDFEGPDEYGHWSRATANALLGEGFTAREFANMGQSLIRRNHADTILCLERSLVLFDLDRADYYDQEILTQSRVNSRLSIELADFTKALDNMFGIVEDTIRLPINTP